MQVTKISDFKEKKYVRIYERACEIFIQHETITSWKMKRGYLRIVKMDGNYSVVWTFRRKQNNCERLASFFELDSAIDFVKESTFMFCGRRARPGIRDSQKKKIYIWELKVLDEHKMPKLSENEMTNFINKLAIENNLKLGKIRYRSNGICSYARGMDVHFIPEHMNKVTACHEVAHLIINQLYGGKVAGHGPEWVRVYVDLLVKHCGYSMLEMYVTLKKFKIKIGH